MVKVATIMCVYCKDSLDSFAQSLNSIINQEKSQSYFTNRIYLYIDGPLDCVFKDYIISKSNDIHKIIFSEVNKGLAYGLNTLINSLDDEEFVFRMDSDDICFAHRYITQIKYLQMNPAIDVLGSSIIEMDSSSSKRALIKFYSNKQSIKHYVAFRTPIAHPTTCFRRRVLDRDQCYPENRSNEDIALWFKLIKQGAQFDNITEPLLYFRRNESFWHKRGLVKAKEELDVYLRGIHSLHGITFLLAIPFLRFLIRLLPSRLLKIVYSLRNFIQ